MRAVAPLRSATATQHGHHAAAAVHPRNKEMHRRGRSPWPVDAGYPFAPLTLVSAYVTARAFPASYRTKLGGRTSGCWRAGRHPGQATQENPVSTSGSQVDRAPAGPDRRRARRGRCRNSHERVYKREESASPPEHGGARAAVMGAGNASSPYPQVRGVYRRCRPVELSGR